MLDWIGKPHKHINKPTWLQNIVGKKKSKRTLSIWVSEEDWKRLMES